MVDMWAARGFSKTDLVALAGAHTVGRQLDGADMDNTVGEWDNRFYSDVANGTASQPVVADVLMSRAEETSEEWRAVGQSQKSFVGAFVPAMEKLSMMGNNRKNLIDCSDVVKSYAGKAKGPRRTQTHSKGRRPE